MEADGATPEDSLLLLLYFQIMKTINKASQLQGPGLFPGGMGRDLEDTVSSWD